MAARALGIAVLLPFVVRLAEGGERALAALVRLMEAVGVGDGQVLLGDAQQEIEAGPGRLLQIRVAQALHRRRRVGASHPLEEHRPLLVGEQADERELGARRSVVDHGAVAGEDGGDELAAELARVALDLQVLVALEDDVLFLLAFRIVEAGLHGGPAILGESITTNKKNDQGPVFHRYCFVASARARIRPNRLSV